LSVHSVDLFDRVLAKEPIDGAGRPEVEKLFEDFLVFFVFDFRGVHDMWLANIKFDLRIPLLIRLYKKNNNVK
jgi:hypothetical protein